MDSFRSRTSIALLVVVAFGLLVPPARSAAAVTFESGPVRPLALTGDRDRLLLTNIPDGRLEILRVTESGLEAESSILVGLEPVAVALRNDGEAWVVNHLSDSISIVDISGPTPSLIRTLLVGDEPQDIVFASGRAYITTARRGQNSPSEPALSTPGVGRADLWVFDPNDLGDQPGGEPVAVLSLFGDSPRGLAVSADGTRVYASVFKSGNRTTIVSAFAVCPGGAEAPPCIVDQRVMPGGLPPPNENFEGIPQPHTGLIVKFDPSTDAWVDELGRDWTNAIEISLPDYDVFEIDAAADVPREVRAFSGVGTVLYNLAVHPISGRVYVSNTEARNEVRFEPVVRGQQHLSRISILSADGVVARHLNKHIDYAIVPSPPGTAERSIALPLAMHFEPDGETLYLAAFGSGSVGVFDVASLEDDTFEPGSPPAIPVSGGGPCGLALDAERRRLYVATRFDNGVSVIDLEARREVEHLRFHSPEPASVVRGRRWLYDARATSSNGEATCASCHVFADVDDLAWDLGDPGLPVVANPNPLHDVILQSPLFEPFWMDFHPLKGPLTTQTLRGMDHHGPMHWRGDRSGALGPSGDAGDERAAFQQFNGAFVSLLGAAHVLPQEALDDLTDFVLAIRPGPNPHRALDNTLSSSQERARFEFFGPEDGQPDPLGSHCVTCHTVDPEAGRFGTATHMSANGEAAQIMKIPSLRSAYRKVGMFNLFPSSFRLAPGGTGPQVRGFGFVHDGSLGMFIATPMEYVMAFDTDFAPIVGQQISADRGSSERAIDRIDLLLERCAIGECDLMATAFVNREARSWLVTGDGLESDRRNEPLSSVDALLDLAAGDGATVTFTALPPGMGTRRALDRDGDGDRDGDELDAGTNPADPSDFTEPCTEHCDCTGDCNGDAEVTVDEILAGVQIALGSRRMGTCRRFDANDDGTVTVDEVLQAVHFALNACV